MSLVASMRRPPSEPLEGKSFADIQGMLYASQFNLNPEDLNKPLVKKARYIDMLLGMARAEFMDIKSLDTVTNIINLIRTKLQSSPRPVDKQNFEYYDNLTAPKLREVLAWEEKCAATWQRLEDVTARFWEFCQTPGNEFKPVPVEITKEINKIIYDISELKRERTSLENNLTADAKTGKHLVPEQIRGEVTSALDEHESQRIGRA